MGRWPGVGQPRSTFEADDGREEAQEEAAEHGREEACDDGGREDVMRIAGPPDDGRDSCRDGNEIARLGAPPREGTRSDSSPSPTDSSFSIGARWR